MMLYSVCRHRKVSFPVLSSDIRRKALQVPSSRGKHCSSDLFTDICSSVPIFGTGTSLGRRVNSRHLLAFPNVGFDDGIFQAIAAKNPLVFSPSLLRGPRAFQCERTEDEARRDSSRAGQARLAMRRKRNSRRCTALGLVLDLITGRDAKCNYPVACYSRCWMLALVKRWSDNVPSQLHRQQQMAISEEKEENVLMALRVSRQLTSG